MPTEHLTIHNGQLTIKNVKSQMSNGYTFVELLVVLTIIAILSLAAFINFKSTSQDQALKSALSDVQSILRLAQSNATAGMLCGGSTASYWYIQFKTTNKDLELGCQPSQGNLPSVIQKTLTLGSNIQIDSIQSTTCSPVLPVFVSFTPLSGCMTFADNATSPLACPSGSTSSSSCTPNQSSLTVTLKNTTTGNPKALIIDKGGRFYEQ